MKASQQFDSLCRSSEWVRGGCLQYLGRLRNQHRECWQVCCKRCRLGLVYRKCPWLTMVLGWILESLGMGDLNLAKSDGSGSCGIEEIVKHMLRSWGRK